MAYLEIKNFTKKYGQNEVLKGIDMQIEKGQVLTILGSSGSGKTTLLRCINFLETVDSGCMVLDGETLLDTSVRAKESESSIRKKRLNFGLVFQSFNLFPQYSVKKNITLAPTMLLASAKKEEKARLKQSGLSGRELSAALSEFVRKEKARIDAEADTLLQKVGLTDKKDAYPCNLSGGQCQRVAIARALALRPKILCFDEPTSALDPELTGEVLKVIRSLKDKDTTMLIVTHEMGFARNVSDRVVFMSDGVIEEQGTPEEIFDSPKSEKLVAFLAHIGDKETYVHTHAKY